MMQYREARNYLDVRLRIIPREFRCISCAGSSCSCLGLPMRSGVGRGRESVWMSMREESIVGLLGVPFESSGPFGSHSRCS
ncbi:hypothetical protein JAAARDRAFT_616749 [Jaapia argillacea MUCL 33604]|uniref:Uncharacterized protein n=1 Tax=Jaapia argillacea MUCL 33604 TaxID=933084 RepID=A0A067PGV2_9AGAM|nr:hypothetical protein JAAARDRAFT_616749 [Jaapia argillacea MUCL 33604]